MTMIMDAYTRRLIQIAIDKLGPPPCKFSWIVAGSHARNEVHMLSDQDSAIVLADHATENDRIYFKHLAMIVSNYFASCDYPLCPGKFMIRNAKVVPTFKCLEEVLQEMGCQPRVRTFTEHQCVLGNSYPLWQ